MIAVCAHAVLIEATEVEITNLPLLLRLKCSGVAHRVNTHIGIHRYQSVRCEVDLRPVMDGLCPREGVPSRLPARGYAVQPAQSDEQERLLAAVTIPISAAMIAYVANRRIFQRET